MNYLDKSDSHSEKQTLENDIYWWADTMPTVTQDVHKIFNGIQLPKIPFINLRNIVRVGILATVLGFIRFDKGTQLEHNVVEASAASITVSHAEQRINDAAGFTEYQSGPILLAHIKSIFMSPLFALQYAEHDNYIIAQYKNTTTNEMLVVQQGQDEPIISRRTENPNGGPVTTGSWTRDEFTLVMDELEVGEFRLVSLNLNDTSIGSLSPDYEGEFTLAYSSLGRRQTLQITYTNGPTLIYNMDEQGRSIPALNIEG